jgi:hypothetical protein
LSLFLSKSKQRETSTCNTQESFFEVTGNTHPKSWKQKPRLAVLPKKLHNLHSKEKERETWKRQKLFEKGRGKESS